MDVLHDWKELSKALLDDKACERRGETATLHLGFLLQASVHRACTGSLDLTSSGPRCPSASLPFPLMYWEHLAISDPD